MKDAKAAKAAKATTKTKEKTKEKTLAEVANAIRAHLQRFERDPKVNRVDPKYKTAEYYCVNAHASGGRVGVQYVAYRGPRYLDKGTAIAYLAWLDAGHVGTHVESMKAYEDRQERDTNWVEVWGASKSEFGIRGPSRVWVVDEGKRWRTRDRPEALGYKSLVRKDDASAFVSPVMEAAVEEVRRWLLAKVASAEETLNNLRERLDELDVQSPPSQGKAKKVKAKRVKTAKEDA